MSKNNETALKDSYENEAIDWEASRIEASEKSVRRAWMVTIFSSLLTVFLGIAIMLMMPLKEKLPYVIAVDNITGIPEIITTMKHKSIKPTEAWNKHWLVEYVRARESYNWYTLQNDYDKVGLFSSPEVGFEYAELFNGVNALDQVYKNKVEAKITIISVVPTGDKTGTVRFRKVTKKVKDKGKGNITRWIATIAFEYRNPSKLKESVRLINPFGFQVLSYRVDPEMIEVTK